MRIIAGTYGGRVLKSPADNKTRPTSDRLRESLFNILAPLISGDMRFLDLCAGTGAVGIEAISRGAAHSTFVDRSRRSCALIEENLDILEIPESQTEVLALSAENFTGRSHETGWDIVFFDPPYAMNYSPVLHEFGRAASPMLNEHGKLIVEHHAKSELPDAVGHLRRWRILKQGETRLSFYERN
ncbi:MAG TPA: 16S rRNA (guanine(966)-N(2))-methyltransferase RsmD [Pyrinomonadaceae bacterium]|nr:16S rRNA (guanine(966)-N(2))-methyltransferase RsmD [Pyrinomonadaceae bacterium]HMP66058.1 16S rRNA (guanine(966)-N(2))-methyltransferase RsmD [Pyrinomonadaceae bacterium]